jgi:hypothetical protein
MQHSYEYSKWDAIHEPYNVVENVLNDNDSVYKALQPTFDFTLCDNNLCYISEVLIWPGDCGPFQIEMFVANSLDMWSFVKAYQCERAGVTKF